MSNRLGNCGAKLLRLWPFGPSIHRYLKLYGTFPVTMTNLQTKINNDTPRHSFTAPTRSPEGIPNPHSTRVPRAHSNEKGLEIGIQRAASCGSSSLARLGRAPILLVRVSAFFWSMVFSGAATVSFATVSLATVFLGTVRLGATRISAVFARSGFGRASSPHQLQKFVGHPRLHVDHFPIGSLDGNCKKVNAPTLDGIWC